MKKCLLALSKKDVREVVGFALGTRYQIELHEAGNARDAIELLAKEPDISLVICEYPGISDVLFRHLVALNRKRDPENPIRVVVCCSTKPDGDQTLKVLPVEGYANWVNIVDSLFKVLDPSLAGAAAAVKDAPSPDSHKDLSDDAFCQIKTTLLIRVGPLQADVFIRLSSTKYVKLFQEGDQFEEEDYRRFLIDKKMESLFLRRDECSEFLIKFKADLLKMLQAEVLGNEPQPELLDAIHETVHELLGKLGPTEEVQEVVKANIQVTIKAMGKNPRLSDILNRMKVEKGKYISSHSTLLPQIACSLAAGMDWKSDLTYQKLTLAAFLHDTSLTNHQLAAVKNLTELSRRKIQFSEDEVKAYRNHPMRAQELARQFHEVPPDVDVIVMQHHEQPDGSGFPRGLTQTHISPLAAVFIVAHDLVSSIFEADGKFVLQSHLETVKDRYNVGNFRKLYKLLTEMKL